MSSLRSSREAMLAGPVASSGADIPAPGTEGVSAGRATPPLAGWSGSAGSLRTDVHADSGKEAKTLHVGDVLDLAAAQSAEAEDRLEKLFEWDFERTMTTVRLLFAAAGSLLVALFAALFKEKAVIETWHVAAIGGSSGVFALVGAILLRRARTAHREYIAALQLLNAAQPLGPLLARYLAKRARSR